MRVKATGRGWYHNTEINPGDVFTLSDKGHFSKTWMEQVPDKVPATKSLYEAGKTGCVGYTGPTPNKANHQPEGRVR